MQLGSKYQFSCISVCASSALFQDERTVELLPQIYDGAIDEIITGT
jgi:hypothetical protein